MLFRSRFEMKFTPILDRHANTNALIIASNQHQVFGRFDGEGTVTIGEEKYEFKKSNTRAILDWGRGVWTYKNT